MCIVGANASEGLLHRWSKEAANVDAATALATFIFVCTWTGSIDMDGGCWWLAQNDLF
jgi:hypothetical protein